MVNLLYYDVNMLRKLLMMAVLLIAAVQSAAAQTGTWSGKLEVQGTQLTLVFHLDDDYPTIDSPDQGAKGIPAKIERSDMGKIIVTVPSLAARYEGIHLMNRIVGTFSQMGMSFPLTLNPGEDRPARPQTPQGPFPYATEEVSFKNGDIVLNGTLTLPEEYTKETPALIMVTGSGIQNRDEELFEHKPFAVIADAFARAGIATLRYDDRGFNGYEGDLNACTTEDFKTDAEAALNLLKERFENVGIIGHSEGGTIAMMLAAEQKADFIISLAGMVISGAETLIDQNKAALLEAGFTQEASDTYCKLLEKTFEASVKGTPLPDTDDYDLPEALEQNYYSVLSQLQIPYMRYFLALDMRPLLGRIPCPLLALNGTMDIQVDCTKNLDTIRKHIAHNVKMQIQKVEGVNHLFQHCKSGTVAEYRTIEETISPEVLDIMIKWISDLK